MDQKHVDQNVNVQFVFVPKDLLLSPDDEQLHDNKLKREKKTAKVNKLTAGVEGLTEDIHSTA